VRVALIAPPWIPVPPPAYGGTEAVLDVLARGLAVAGHDVVLATTGDSTCPVKRTWTYPFARGEEIGSVVIELRHLLHAYDAVEGADIIHDHTVAGPILAERFSASPVVTTNHGPFTEDVKALYRVTAHLVPVLAISHHQASMAGDIPIARVIHHGVDVDRFPVGPGTGGYLLFLGRMSPTKGVREAVEIARRTGAPLIIAAKMRERGEREYFDSMIAPLLTADVQYAGEVGSAEKLALLGNAFALLNPIRWDEPFGMCMIEALASGTPIIATPRGAVPEIVDHGVTGFLCADDDQMDRAIADVASLDRRACRAAAETRFSANRLVADHVALYRDLLAGESDHRQRDVARPSPTMPATTRGQKAS
jgi:glycosyltransferase involved in cell wall biosynthesis